MSNIQYCVVTSVLIKTYKKPEIDSNSVNTIRRGTSLGFTLVKGQKLPLNHPQNDNWGFNAQGKFYFWLGDTNYQNGHLSLLPEDISLVQQSAKRLNPWSVLASAVLRILSGSRLPRTAVNPETLEPGGYSMSICKVIVPLLQIHEKPNLTSPVHQTVPAGTTLTFVQRVQGAMVHLNNSNNANWGKSPNNLFFPLGGTDHPNG